MAWGTVSFSPYFVSGVREVGIGVNLCDRFMAASKVLGEETVAGGGQEGSQAGDT